MKGHCDSPEQEKIRRYREQVEARAKEEAAGLQQDMGPAQDIDSRFIRECLSKNEQGDGLLYCSCHRGEFIFNKSSRQWLAWAGHHWEEDIKELSIEAVETGPVRLYLEEAKRVEQDRMKAIESGDREQADSLEKLRDALFKRCKKLRSRQGRANCLEMAHSCGGGIAIRGDEIDQSPMLLACPNGVVELETGEFRPGRPEDFLLKACPVEWQGIDASRETWLRALYEIYNGRQELVDFDQRLFGMACIGEVREHVIAVLSGQGRNGKGSVIIGLLAYVLGPLAAAVPPEMLLAQSVKINASAPSPEIMALRGVRLAYASETDEYAKFSANRVKWLTGGDKLSARAPHDRKQQEFDPTHTLFLLTNHKPSAPADDYAFWERVIIVPHKISFVGREPATDFERRKDGELPKKLKKEAPGILAWLVEGCLLYQKMGLAPPPIVKEAVAEYRRDEDILSEFIDQCCVIGEPDLKCRASDIYNEFEAWWEKNVSKNAPKQRKFGQWLGRKFEKKKSNGAFWYHGIGLSVWEQEG